MPRWQRKAREKVHQLNREIIQYTVGPHLEDLRGKYQDLEDVVAYLDAVEEDVVNHARDLLDGDGEQESGGAETRSLRRYAVNLMVNRWSGASSTCRRWAPWSPTSPWSSRGRCIGPTVAS